MKGKLFYNVYCDMDGVLADFYKEDHAVERFRDEQNFFYNLEPISDNVKAIKKMIKKQKKFRVHIITASPHINADVDKYNWIKKYIPEFDMNNFICCRIGDKKLNFMKTQNGILFDDYGKNIREWLENPYNSAVKINAESTILKWFKKNA